ncbi:MAG: PepSY protein [Hyphomicrobiales bacterium]|nr:PepSY protein [Hyphomicrobiales bacterium]
MLKPYLLRLHRWISLLFALPLAVVILTGLLLSLPPILQTAHIAPGSLSLQQVEALMDRHDPAGAARAVRLDTFQNVLTIGDVDVDLATGAETDDEHWLSDLMGQSRGVHQRLVFDLEWLVIASTAAMLGVIALGVLMGWPRFSNSLSGWHKATAWLLLPLVVLSPLTGLFIAAGVTFSQPAPRLPAPTLREAVRMVAAAHDLSRLEWIRARGGRLMARVNDGAGQVTYLVARDGLKPAPSNWPRTFHEGTFLGLWGGVMNLALSLAFTLLLASGVAIWARRAFRRRRRTRQPSSRIAKPAAGAPTN